MERFETTEPIAVSLDIGAGHIVIEARARDDAAVDVQPTVPEDRGDVAAARKTTVAFANGTLTIEGPNWRQWRPRGFGSVEVRIEVPEGSSVGGDLGVGELRTAGRLGSCRIHVGAGSVKLGETGPTEIRIGAGDVTADVIGGRADIKSAGSVRIGRIDGPATLKNPNGDTWIGEVTGHARVASSNGSIAIGLARGSVVAKTARGDVTIAEIGRGSVEAESALGTIEIGVPNGTPAWLDLETRFGRVRNRLDEAQRPGSDEETVDIRARTSMGDITIYRANQHEPATAS